MQKIISYSIAVALFIFSFISINFAQATVGGPTYKYNLRTAATPGQPINEIVYVEHSLSGKGCPPEIFKLNLNTGNTTTLVGCDDGQHEINFRNTLSNFPYQLQRVHLAYNQIKAHVNVLREIDDDPNSFMGKRTDFSLDLYKGDIKIASHEYSGCYVDQPHIIEGYSTVQGKLVAIIISTVGDCFEGGYTYEKIVPITPIDLTYTYPLDPRIDSSPAVADADQENGNLLVYANELNTEDTSASTSTESQLSVDENKDTEPSPDFSIMPTSPVNSEDTGTSTLAYIITIVVLLVIILLLGIALNKKSKNII